MSVHTAPQTCEPAELAEWMLAQAWPDAQLAIDPAPIANWAGLSVCDGRMDADVASALSIYKEEPTVILARDVKRNSQRMLCARALGHYVQVPEKLDVIIYREGSGATHTAPPEQDRWANQFAHALLLPERLVRALRSTGRSADRLAAVFGVSEAVMVNRLKNLSLYR